MQRQRGEIKRVDWRDPREVIGIDWKITETRGYADWDCKIATRTWWIEKRIREWFEESE